MINTAYAGTRVVEIASGLSAGMAGRFFADFGADVVRIEQLARPVVDPADRAVLAWARGNKRIAATSDARALTIGDIEPLIAGADLVITDLSPSGWAGSFPSPESLVDAHPGTVFLDITAFGRTGPYANYAAPDLVTLALSGFLFVCGLNDRAPLRTGVDLVDILTGVNAAGGAMIALHHARRSGQGQVVDVSNLQTMLGSALTFTTGYSFQGLVKRRSSSRMVAVGALVPCQDGHVLINTFRAPSEVLFVLLEDDRLLEERFADFIGREVNQNELVEVMAEAAARRTMSDLFTIGQELRLQNAMVQSPLETPSCPQHATRRFFQPLGLDSGATIPAPTLPSLPVDARTERSHAPASLDNTVEPLDAVTWRNPAVERETGAAGGLTGGLGRNALEGLKVVELTFAWAGPFMGRMLADHGAQVVKIESRSYPDTAKGTDLVDLSFGDNDRWMDRSCAYLIANPDKFHLGMELTDPVGKEVLLDLVRWADVLIENFTPRVLPNLGLSWDLFREANPSLVMISATGFGHSGPYRDFGAWGWGLECQAGMTYSSGYFEDTRPLSFLPTIPDSLSATMGITAIMAALEERRRTGVGQWIDLSQYECATFATLTDVLRAGSVGSNRPRPGNRHAWMAPQGVYRCEGPDAWVAVAVETDEQWRGLCEVLARPDLAADTRLSDHAGRYAHHDRIDDAIAAWTAERNKHDAMTTLQQSGVPAGAVQHSKDLQHDPHVRAIEYFRAAWAKEIGLRIWPGPWYSMQGTPGDVRRGTSDFGEDNERVLRDLLGYDDDRVQALLSGGVFSDVQEGLIKPAAPGLPVATQLERGTALSWDDEYRALPAEVAQRNQRWRRAHGLPEIRLDGR